MRSKIIVIFFGAASLLSGCGQRQSAAPVAPINAELARAQAEIEKAPDLPLGYSNLAMLYMKEARKTGNFSLNDRAVAAVERALEISPGDVPARKLEASLHLAYHRFHEAIEAAEKLRVELPSDPFAYGVLSDAYVETGDYAKAVEATQQMVDLRPNTASYARVAQLRVLHGDHKGAVEMFTQAARVADPVDKETRSWALVQLGDEHWRHGKYAEAGKIYDEALQIFPEYFLAMVSKARVRASVGDFETAEQLIGRAQQNGPIANAILLLGEIYEMRGEKQKADEQYDAFEAMQADLGVAADHRRLVLTLADRGKTSEALEMARSEYAAEKSINSADILAWSLYRSGDPKQAELYIREAMRLRTRDAQLMFHAGMIAKALGKTAEARKLLSDALALNPAFSLVHAAEARTALADLGS